MTKDLEYLIQIVKEASLLVSDNYIVDKKGGMGDLVTNLDYKIEEFLINKMKSKYPTFDVVSEEYNSTNTLSKNCYTIDPIDGTVNFANGLPLWVIQMALIKNGKVCASVIYAPKLNELYSADSFGAYLNGNPICVTDKDFNNSMLVIDGKHKYTLIQNLLNHTHHARILGSAGLSHCFVASGRAGATIFKNNSLWDYTAGMFLCKMAGAYTIDKPNCHICANSKELALIIEKYSDEIDSKL